MILRGLGAILLILEMHVRKRVMRYRQDEDNEAYPLIRTTKTSLGSPGT